MLTLMLGTMILTLTYGAFWHNQPARRRNTKTDDDFRFERLVNNASELERKARVVLAAKGGIPVKQIEFFRSVLRAFRGLNPKRRILVDPAAVASSIPATLFKIKGERDESVAVRTT